MAILVPTAACNLSAANAFYTGDATASNFGWYSTTKTSTIPTTGTTISLTFSANDTLVGVVLPLAYAGTSSASITVQLQENVASVWTNRGTAITKTAAQLFYGNTPYTFEFLTTDFNGINYAVTTAASTWRLNITTSANNIFSLRTSNGTAPGYICYMATTRSYAANDALVCTQPVVQDIDATFKGILGTGDTVYATAIHILNPTTLPTLSSPQPMFSANTSASRTLTVDGCVLLGGHSSWTIGTSASPVTFANQFNLRFPALSVGTQSGIYSSIRSASWTSGTYCTMLWYGATPSVRWGKLYADAAVGSTTIQVTGDVSSWQSGWRLSIGKQDQVGYAEQKIYTISGTPTYDGTKTTITLTGAITGAKRKAWTDLSGTGTVFVVDGYGIRVTGNATNRPEVWNFVPSNLTYVGVSFLDMTYMANAQQFQVFSADPAANRSQYVIRNCVHAFPTSTPFSLTLIWFIPREGYVIDGLYTNGLTAFNGNVQSFNWFAGTSNTISNNSVINTITHASPAFNGGGIQSFTTFDNNILENGNSPININGTNHSISNLYIYGWADGSPPAVGAIEYGSSLTNTGSSMAATIKIDNVRINRSTTAVAYNGVTIPGIVETNLHLGDDVANTTDFYWMASSQVQHNISSPVGQTNPSISSTYSTGAQAGSKLRITNYNGTSGDYRSWYREGNFLSSGSNLQAKDSTAGLTLDPFFYTTAQNTSTFKHGVQVGCTIGSASYYAGTYTLPTLKVNYDVTLSTTAVASASTSAQTLSALFTPSTNGNTVSMELKTVTDASTANSLVTWGGPMLLNVRKYGYTFQSNSIAINQTTDAVLATLATPSVNPYITVSNSATVAAYTGIAINHSTRTITISTSHSLKEIYDYAQYDLSLDANFFTADWLTTLDGSTYTSAYSLVITSSGSITGAGTLDVGSNTITINAGGTYSSVTVLKNSVRTYSTVTLTGLQSGSTVAFYDGSNTLLTFTASSGTTASQAFLSDSPTIRYIVRKSGYVGIDVTITASAGITSLPTPQTFNQSVDDSVVSLYTGISVSGGTITVTSAHTLTEIYGYCQWKSHQTSADMLAAIPMTTSDGLSFSSPYNFTIGATGSVSGGTLNIGANTITLTAGGSATALIISNSQTLTSITVSGVVSGSRVQLYNTSTSTEIYNAIPGTSLFLNVFWTTNQSVRLRVKYTSGLSAYLMFRSSGTLQQTGLAFTVAQVVDSVYNGNAIDGSTVTECSVSGTVVRIYVDDPDNQTTIQRIYDWYQYLLSTQTGIRDQDSAYLVAIDSTTYVCDPSMRIVNLDVVNPLSINGGILTNNTGNPTTVIDNSNGASIAINSDRVVYAGGIPSASQNAAALLDYADGIETGLTLKQALRLISAATAGKLSGAGTPNIAIRNVPDSKTRISATVDADGNRTAVTVDAS